MSFSIRSSRNVFLALLVALPLAWAPNAMAQEGSEGDAAGQDAPTVDVSQEQIQAFAAAMVEVQQLGQEWTQKMQQTEDQEELSQMQQQAQEEMMGAIEDQGMTVEEYNEIATAAQQDQELAQQIQQAAQQ